MNKTRDNYVNPLCVATRFQPNSSLGHHLVFGSLVQFFFCSCFTLTIGYYFGTSDDGNIFPFLSSALSPTTICTRSCCAYIPFLHHPSPHAIKFMRKELRSCASKKNRAAEPTGRAPSRIKCPKHFGGLNVLA